MSIGIIATYYNNPHFITVQLAAFEKYLREDFKLYVFNDAEDDTHSILHPDRLARADLMNEAKNLGVEHVLVPQSIHAPVSDGGLVPHGLPANHPTERHRATLHWILSCQQELFDQHEFIIIMESDAFPCRPIYPYKMLGRADEPIPVDIIATMRLSHKVTYSKEQLWPVELRGVQECVLDFFTMYFFMFRTSTVRNLDTLNIGGFAATDTGGMSHFFIQNNFPRYRILNMPISGDRDKQLDFFYLNQGDTEPSFVHYRGGTNWDRQSVEYYSAKLRGALKEYFPECWDGTVLTRDVSSRDGESTFKAGT